MVVKQNNKNNLNINFSINIMQTDAVIEEFYGHSYSYEKGTISANISILNDTIFDEMEDKLIVISNYIFDYEKDVSYFATIIYCDCGDNNPYEVNPEPSCLVYQNNPHTTLFLEIIADISREFYNADDPHRNHFKPDMPKMSFSDFKSSEKNKLISSAIDIARQQFSTNK